VNTGELLRQQNNKKNSQLMGGFLPPKAKISMQNDGVRNIFSSTFVTRFFNVG